MSYADEHKQMAAALGRIPSGLFVLTARQGHASTGMLASWVQQCSFDPPQVSVALGRDRAVSAWLGEGAFFALNILDNSQTDMISHFGRGFQADEPAFNGLDVTQLPSGPTVLDEALAFLECRVRGRWPSGDHDLLVAEVIGGRVLSDGQPMVHVRRSGTHY
jgi:flavin reductase (DIM6/NTAB) family NADH-FMN oxidoreductase RutF